MMEAYFSGGCFWCITPTFNETCGVIGVESGFSGGDEVNPSYLDVKNQKTNHRETIKITYDDEKVSFGELVDIFLNSVDLFDGGGQYIDRGHSYTLAIYYNSMDEKKEVEERIKRIEQETGQKVMVSIEKFKSFYKADEDHQDYYLKNPEAFNEELIKSGRKR